jgi:hypothetical protein
MLEFLSASINTLDLLCISNYRKHKSPLTLFTSSWKPNIKVPFASYLKEPQQVPSAKTIYVGIFERVNHKYLGPPLLVLVLVGHAVDLEAVALQGAALGEGFLAQVALVWPHACTGVTVYIQGARCTVHTGSFSAAQAAVSSIYTSAKAGSNHPGM